MENFVSNVRNLCISGQLKEAAALLTKNYEFLSRHQQNIDNLIQSFDVQQHSIGYVACLCIKLTLPDVSDIETIIVVVQDFIANCNREQILIANDYYCLMCHNFTLHLINHNQALRGIAILTKAIEKIQKSPTQLTSIHSDVVQLCLVSRCLKPALYLLDQDISDIIKENNEFDSQFFLQYYYYGGLVYAALKDFERAHYFLEVVISVPAGVVSQIMLEAYRKFILISLIRYGRITVAPKYTPAIVLRTIKPLCQIYHDIASAFIQPGKPSRLQEIIEKETVSLQRDGNLGLAKQVLVALYENNIKSLTKTFLTLSLEDVANRAELKNGAAEAEHYILKMIEKGQIYASINEKNGMVSFLDNPEQYSNPQMLQTLNKEMQYCFDVSKKFRQMDIDLTLLPAYVKKSMGTTEETDTGGLSSTFDPKMFTN